MDQWGSTFIVLPLNTLKTCSEMFSYIWSDFCVTYHKCNTVVTKHSVAIN